MFSLATLALASVAAVNGLVIPVARDTQSCPTDVQVPADYAQGYLECYSTYHTRYLAVGCDQQHDSSFFNQCCHPLLATETLQANRPAQCDPANHGGDNGEDCQDDGDNSSSSSSSSPATPPPPPSNVGQDPSAPKPAPPAPAPAPPAPKPAPPPPPPPAPKPSPKPSPPPSNNNGGLNIVGNLFSGGIATFFTQNGNAGACGTVHPDSAKIVALPTDTYANGAHCGKEVLIKDTETGHTSTAIVADECPTCDNDACLDMSTGLFSEFADFNKGVFNIQWGFTGN